MARLPCSILSLDVQDVMGSHTLNIHGSLMKYKLDRNGVVIGQEAYNPKPKEAKKEDGHGHGHGHDGEDMPALDTVRTELVEKQGCKIKGHVVVNKVPGNFHISSHAYGPIIQQLASEGYFDFDVSHRIHHISFGDD